MKIKEILMDDLSERVDWRRRPNPNHGNRPQEVIARELASLVDCAEAIVVELRRIGGRDDA